MEIEAVTDATQAATNPISAVQESEWNGKDVQSIPQTRAWLVMQIPIQTPNPLPSLADRITSVNSRGLPTVEDVLTRHNLAFGSRFYDRAFEQLSTTEYAWVVIPLKTSDELPCLLNRAYIDTNDYGNIDRVLQRHGITSPYSSQGTLV